MQANEIDISKKIGPTLTLAQLYEAQNQYIDALVICEKLYTQNPNDEVLDKINNLRPLIAKDHKEKYNSELLKILSEEEMRKFLILPKVTYEGYWKAFENLDEDRISQDIEDQKIDNVENIEQKVEKTVGKDGETKSVSSSAKSNASIRSLVEVLENNFDPEKKIMDLNISDLMLIFAKLYEK
jgi:hypothetical protein